jgi:hypothetical protein
MATYRLPTDILDEAWGVDYGPDAVFVDTQPKKGIPVYLKTLYERFMAHASNMELSPGQRAEWLRMAQRVKEYT